MSGIGSSIVGEPANLSGFDFDHRGALRTVYHVLRTTSSSVAVEAKMLSELFALLAEVGHDFLRHLMWLTRMMRM